MGRDGLTGELVSLSARVTESDGRAEWGEDGM